MASRQWLGPDPVGAHHQALPEIRGYARLECHHVPASYLTHRPGISRPDRERLAYPVLVGLPPAVLECQLVAVYFEAGGYRFGDFSV